MKYRVTYDGEEYIVITEAGRVGMFRYYDGKASVEYYRSIVDDSCTRENIWDVLGEGQMFYEDYPEETTVKRLLSNLFEFITNGEEMVLDNTMYTHLLSEPKIEHANHVII